MEFSGKVAVITGGGSGIGRVTAHAFSKEGASVVIVDRNEQKCMQVSKEIIAQGGKVLPLVVDVSKSEEVGKIPGEATKAFGSIDILFNNAGISGIGTVTEISEEYWDRVISVNLKSVFLCSKFCIPAIQKGGGGGVIVNNASIFAFANLPRSSAYATSKAGILALTRSMAVDYAKDNIRVVAICPGYTDTPLIREAASLRHDSIEEMFKKRSMSAPLGRVAKPEEIANLVLFLASQRASFITGVAYIIDGGILSTVPGWELERTTS